MKKYNHRKIEAKWQKEWERRGLYRARERSSKQKCYLLVEFPYPSGDGLHVGHVRSYVALDIIARKRRMEGKNVLYPMGWDAFGLPTENYAVKTGIHPALVTKRNTANFRRQIKSLGGSFDWSREINTADPDYYRWTQWIFLQFFKRGLAYKSKTIINWCPSCLIGLANEEVAVGRCERCGAPVERREKEQWLLRITAYAERLLRDLQNLDYAPEVKRQQENWIGRSAGALIRFPLVGGRRGQAIEVFTTRPDTILGATYLVVAPEHDVVAELKSQIDNWPEVQKYVQSARGKSELERTAEGREKIGVELKGVRVKNPASGEEIPVWVADYVLADYGTGAIMAVPVHDERDRVFAEKHRLPAGRGDLVSVAEALAKTGGKKTVRYKLRDWIFSRQRYWGEPIPLVWCDRCRRWRAVPDKDLPVKLPKVKNYRPRRDGESPLASVERWVKTKCPVCAGPARRETDTMPNWAGSSWYYLRYTDPRNSRRPADPARLKYWLPVDWYNGGMEHVTLHLLYSRFWHKFLYDLKLVPTPEPYGKRTAHGLILAADGLKMSKSRGNVVSPDEIIRRFGADTLRLYEMFIGPFTQAVSWQESGIVGPRRFLERVFALAGTRCFGVRDDEALSGPLAQTVEKVGADIETMSFNTAVSALMVLATAFGRAVSPSRRQWEVFLRLLAPFAPHLAEELWCRLGRRTSIHLAPWPKGDGVRLRGVPRTIVIQVNGVRRATLAVGAETKEAEIKVRAAADPKIAKWLAGKEVKRTIYIPNRLLNFVV